MNRKAVFFEGVGKALYRGVSESDHYRPTPEEQERHGANVITRPWGDPGENEIQVRAVAGGICTHEVSIFTGELTVPRFPWLAGHEAVYRVTRTGPGVKGFQEGDLVACCWYHGQWSEVVNGPARSAYRLPDGLRAPACWLIEPAASVVNAVGYFGLLPGSRVLVVGAGFMGLLIVQMLSHCPLSDLVVAEVKPHNRKLAAQGGATEILDPANPAGVSRLEELARTPFDHVVECSGTQAGLDAAVKLTAEAGTLCLFGWHRKPRSLDLSLGHLRGQRILNTSPGMDAGRSYERHWPTTIRMIERGVFDLTPLITHRYPVADVQRAMEESCARPDGFIKSVIEF